MLCLFFSCLLDHRPFNCTFCDKAFTTNGNLSRHIRTSHQVKSDSIINTFDLNAPHQTHWFSSVTSASTADRAPKDSSALALFQLEGSPPLRSPEDIGKSTIEANEIQSLSHHHTKLISPLGKEGQIKAVHTFPPPTVIKETLSRMKLNAGDMGPHSNSELESVHHMVGESWQGRLPMPVKIHPDDVKQLEESDHSLEKNWPQTNLLNMASVRLQNTALFQIKSDRSSFTVEKTTHLRRPAPVSLMPFNTNLLTTLWPRVANSLPLVGDGHSGAVGTSVLLTTSSNISVTSTPIRTDNEGSSKRAPYSDEFRQSSSTSSSTGLWTSTDSDGASSPRLTCEPGGSISDSLMEITSKSDSYEGVRGVKLKNDVSPDHFKSVQFSYLQTSVNVWYITGI